MNRMPASPNRSLPVCAGLPDCFDPSALFLGDLVRAGYRMDGRFEQSEPLEDFLLELSGDFRMIPQEILGVLASLADALALERIPGAAFLEDVLLRSEVYQISFFGNPAAVHDVELHLLEGRRYLVLHHFDPGSAADHRLAVLDCSDPPDVHPLRSVKLQRVATGGGFWISEHHTDLHSNLIDEDDAGLALGNGAGELAQGLAHQAGLNSHVRVAHFTFQLRLGDERGDRVDHQNIDCPGAYQHLGDLERLLSGVRLGKK